MTVIELTKELQKCPQDAIVVLWNSEKCRYDERISVGTMDNPNDSKRFVVMDMYC